MSVVDIFQRDKSGEVISVLDKDIYKIMKVIHEAQVITTELNTSYHSKEDVRKLFSKLTGSDVDECFWLMLPFYSDFGKNIKVGKDIFINHGCTFMDRGGITLEDGVLIGPKVNLITTNHPLEPSKRHSTISTPIVIKKNAWIGAGAMIMPGVTIGENSVVAAGAVVCKDVEPNTVVGGVPAKVIKKIEEK